MVLQYTVIQNDTNIIERSFTIQANYEETIVKQHQSNDAQGFLKHGCWHEDISLPFLNTSAIEIKVYDTSYLFRYMYESYRLNPSEVHVVPKIVLDELHHWMNMNTHRSRARPLCILRYIEACLQITSDVMIYIVDYCSSHAAVSHTTQMMQEYCVMRKRYSILVKRGE